ncbi:MAG: putative DNA-binding domain-containing protein [Planctomycetota bacterium]
MSLGSIENRFLRLLFDPDTEPRPGDPWPERIELYRRLVVAGTGRVLDAIYRGALDGIEARGLARREDLCRGFLAESPPRTHCREELADRFLAWLESRQRTLLDAEPGLRGMLHDLRLEHEVSHAEDEDSELLGRGRIAALSGGTSKCDAVLRLARWVRVPSSFSGTDERRLCTRDAEGSPRWLRLGPGTWSIVSALLPGGIRVSLDCLADSWHAAGSRRRPDRDGGFWRDLAVLAGARALVGE